MKPRRRFARLTLLGLLLFLLGVAGIVGSMQLFGQDEQSLFYDLEKSRGVPVEYNPDGSVKLARATFTLRHVGSSETIILEKLTYHGPHGEELRDVIKTPTREIVHEWGQKPKVLRDQRTLLGRVGVPPPHEPYLIASVVLTVVGFALIVIGIVRRKRQAKGIAARVEIGPQYALNTGDSPAHRSELAGPRNRANRSRLA